jgi:hypothetical protein
MGERTPDEPQFPPALPTCPSHDLPIISVRQEPCPPKRHLLNTLSSLAFCACYESRRV